MSATTGRRLAGLGLAIVAALLTWYLQTHGDGATFKNREGLLPDEQRGHYREYTVQTPGSDDRGARRIVAGGGGEFYYSDDHYQSFRRIAR